MRIASITLALALVACNAEPTPSEQTPDAATSIDSPPASNCLVKAEYGALGSVTGTAGSMPGVKSATVVLDPGPPGKDDLFIKFPSTTIADTYEITGADANYKTCSLCVTVIADIIAMQGPSKFYFASSGTVTLTGVGGPITGSVSNLAFTEIDISTGNTIGSCTTSIAAGDFTAN